MTEPWTKDRGLEVIRAHQHIEAATLPILHALQDAFGCVPEEAIPLIADALNISRAEVHGVISFYHEFRSKPPGRHVLKLCRAEACQAMGGDILATAAEAKLSVHFGETSPDGAVTLEPVYCLGLCACAPSALLDGKPLGRLDRERLERIIEGAAR
ncbi:MAG: formate dehydrogenase subunit gamma [Alphaproteobacteria bacterium]|nr:formate dehydrogenase subunit gamma [Alphaproteobacteria bacterium]